MKIAVFALPVLMAFASPFAHAEEPLYKVEEGYKVDANTMKGFRAWRAAPVTAAMAPTRKAWSAPR